MNKQGVVGLILLALIFIFFCGVVFLMLYQPWNKIYDKTATDDLTADQLETASFMNGIMIKAPIIIIIVIGIWLLISAANRNRTQDMFG
ncbi:MAG: hypothetical protein ACOC80_00685 [Petrotogales bacterium]